MGGFVYLFVYITGLAILICAIYCRKKKRYPYTGYGQGKVGDPLEWMAWFLYHFVCQKILRNRHNVFLQFLIQAPQVTRDLRALEPGLSIQPLQERYYRKKIKSFLILIYAGNTVALLLHMSSLEAGTIRDGMIRRNSYGEGTKYATVRLETEAGISDQKRKLVVEERVYSEAELKVLFKEAVQSLEKEILQDNIRTDEVRSSLRLPSALTGYPFLLKWESSDYDLMNQKGEICKEDIAKDGELLTLTCTFSYRDFIREYQIPVCIYPPERSEEEQWEKEVDQSMEAAQKKQMYEEFYVLPEKIAGQKVVFHEVVTDYGVPALMLSVLLAAVLCVWLDQQLHNRLEQRNSQMLQEYPVLVNRLTLYMGAGMTIKNAWKKIALEYRDKGRIPRQYVYEEMLFTLYEMKSGVAEDQAYEQFGERCALQPYTRLAGLLTQSIRKGNAALLADLRKEASDAQEERRNLVRKKGEEAGTKLLLPMMMMLGIVMIIIMVPAFLSLS